MSLSSLIASKGKTVAEVASRSGVSAALLESVDARRQPLPLFVAKYVAVVLGVQLWEVVQAAPSTTALTDRVLLNAKPGPSGGSRGRFSSVAMTQPVEGLPPVAVPVGGGGGRV